MSSCICTAAKGSNKNPGRAKQYIRDDAPSHATLNTACDPTPSRTQVHRARTRTAKRSLVVQDEGAADENGAGPLLGDITRTGVDWEDRAIACVINVQTESGIPQHQTEAIQASRLQQTLPDPILYKRIPCVLVKLMN